MPLPRAPRKSGAHRSAGIALFRALLQQCHQQPNNGKTLANIVRNRFRSNANLQSPTQLKSAFNAGYEGLTILQEATDGNAQCRSLIQSLLDQVPKRLKLGVQFVSFNALHEPDAPVSHAEVLDSNPLFLEDLDSEPDNVPARAQRGKESFMRSRHILRPENTSAAALVARHPILQRPYPVVSGRRRVPVWTRGHDVPFIRIKKPQPHALTVAIKSRFERRQKWLDWRTDLEQRVMGLAEKEDEWEELIAEETQSLERWKQSHGEHSWKKDHQDMIDGLSEQLREQSRQSHELSEAMFKVVQKEKALAVEEKRARKLERQGAQAKLLDGDEKVEGNSGTETASSGGRRLPGIINSEITRSVKEEIPGQDGRVANKPVPTVRFVRRILG